MQLLNWPFTLGAAQFHVLKTQIKPLALNTFSYRKYSTIIWQTTEAEHDVAYNPIQQDDARLSTMNPFASYCKTLLLC